MTMATRIIVLNKGVVQQVDTPDGIYSKPANTFVARFVGSPPMNLVPVVHEAGRLAVSDAVAWRHDGCVPSPRGLLFGIRPEKLVFGSEGAGPIAAQVAIIERLGAETVVGCRLAFDRHESEPRLLEHDLVFARIPGNRQLRIDDRCSLDYRPADVVWFDSSTGARIPTAADALLAS
jgi:multiple sugar transport system ATP-binding protein